MTDNLRIDLDRLLGRLDALAGIGAIEGGGVCRLALSGEDKAGRDLVVAWMEELGLTVTIDRIGNLMDTWKPMGSPSTVRSSMRAPRPSRQSIRTRTN